MFSGFVPGSIPGGDETESDKTAKVFLLSPPSQEFLAELFFCESADQVAVAHFPFPGTATASNGRETRWARFRKFALSSSPDCLPTR